MVAAADLAKVVSAADLAAAVLAAASEQDRAAASDPASSLPAATRGI